MKNLKNAVSLALAGLLLASVVPNLRAMESGAQGAGQDFDDYGAMKILFIAYAGQALEAYGEKKTLPELRMPYSPITLNRAAHYGGLVLRGGTKRELAQAMVTDGATVLVTEVLKTCAERSGLNEFVSSHGKNDGTVVSGVCAAAKRVKSVADKILSYEGHVELGSLMVTLVNVFIVGSPTVAAVAVVANGAAVAMQCVHTASDPVGYGVKVAMDKVFAGFDSTQVHKVKIATLPAKTEMF